MKVLKIVLSVLLTTILFSQSVYAYNPQTDVKYTEMAEGFYAEQGRQDIDYSMVAYAMINTDPVLLDLFIQEGVRVYVTHSVPRCERTENQNYYNALCYPATFTYNNASKKITKISAPVSIYIYHDTDRADAYIHECGHALDDIAEYITGVYKGEKPISNSSEWQTLYSQYASTMATFDSNAAVNVNRDRNEGFAEAFRLYYSYPQKLQSSCPGVYTFVSNQVSKYAAYVPALNYDNFDYKAYAISYPDLYETYGFDKKALWDHYVNYGQSEGRVATKIIKRKR